MKEPILYTQEQWMDSHLSVAKYYGGIKINGTEYVILNKDGKDLFECSVEAEKLGRNKAIPAGEPADLVQKQYAKEYRKLGRDAFLKKYNLQ